jgi:2-iminobutanoate/2-iminopropanoate deaminase
MRARAACAHFGLGLLALVVLTGAGAPPALGPYRPARCVDGWVFVSGQLPVTGDARPPVADGDIGSQTRRVLDNLVRALASEGAGLQDVVKVTVILASVADMPAMNAVYAEVFDATPQPARTTLPGADFGDSGIRVEIDATARLPAGKGCVTADG